MGHMDARTGPLVALQGADTTQSQAPRLRGSAGRSSHKAAPKPQHRGRAAVSPRTPAPAGELLASVWCCGKGTLPAGRNEVHWPGSWVGEDGDMAQTLSDVIRNSPVRVMPGRYAVVRCADVPDSRDCFMVARDADETTAIAEESKLPALPALATQKGYRLVAIEVAAPFQAVGFLSTVTGALAGAGLDILVVSTYSKDYLLLKEESVAEGLQALAEAGFPVSSARGRAKGGRGRGQ